MATGHKHGKFQHLNVPKHGEEDEIFEQRPVNLPVSPPSGGTEGEDNGFSAKKKKRASVLKQKSFFVVEKSKRVRTGRKLKFVDETNQGPLEHTSFSDRLHYCSNSLADDPMDDPHAFQMESRPARCCTIS